MCSLELLREVANRRKVTPLNCFQEITSKRSSLELYWFGRTSLALGRKGPPGSSLGCASAQETLESTPGAHASVGAAPPRPLLTLHVLQLYDLHLRVPPLAPDMKRHMGILEHPVVSLRVALVARTGSPSGVASGPWWGMHSDGHRRGSRHSGDGLAVAGHRAAHGSGRRVPRVVRTGPTGA